MPADRGARDRWRDWKADDCNGCHERASKLELPQAEAGLKLLESFQATAQCQPERALDLIDEARRLHPKHGGRDAVNAALAWMDAGQPERALAERKQEMMPDASMIAFLRSPQVRMLNCDPPASGRVRIDWQLVTVNC